MNCKLSFPRAVAAFTLVEETSKPGEYFDAEVWVHDLSQAEEQVGLAFLVVLILGSAWSGRLRLNASKLNLADSVLF